MKSLNCVSLKSYKLLFINKFIFQFTSNLRSSLFFTSYDYLKKMTRLLRKTIMHNVVIIKHFICYMFIFISIIYNL